MQYALDQFTLQDSTPVLVQGNNSLYTYQNVGSNTALIQGSNDSQQWVDIKELEAQTSTVIEHSYKYLRSIGSTLVLVNRGEGNNTNDSSGNSNPPIGGGSDYKFQVQELNLLDYADKSLSAIVLTTDVAQKIEGTPFKGKIIPTNPSATLAHSYYFQFIAGSMSFSLNSNSNLVMFRFLNEKPTNAVSISNMGNGLVFIALIEGGYLQIMFATDLMSDIKFVKQVQVQENNSNIIIKLLTSDTIEIFNEGISIGTYTHAAPFEKFIHSVNYSEALPIPSITYDLLEAYAKFEYIVPNNAKDGVIYHLINDSELLGKSLKKNDYIQFYNNKHDYIIYRVPEKVTLPEQTNYYRGKHDAIEDFRNIQNPKAGDYALITTDNVTTAYFYSPSENTFKPFAPPNTLYYRGIYSNVASYVPNPKSGDYILVQDNGRLDVAFYNQYLGGFGIIGGVKNTDQLTEGEFNKFYTDGHVLEYLRYLFVNSITDDVLKNYFNSYINKLIKDFNKTTYLTQYSKELIDTNIFTDTLNFTDSEITHNNIVWEHPNNSGYRMVNSNPVGSYNVWKHKEIAPAKCYLKLDFDISIYAYEPSEIYIGLAPDYIGNELQTSATIIAKYDNSSDYITYWYTPYPYTNQIQIKKPTIIIKNGRVFFTQMDGEFLESEIWDSRSINIAIIKKSSLPSLILRQVKLSILEEVSIPYSRFE